MRIGINMQIFYFFRNKTKLFSINYKIIILSDSKFINNRYNYANNHISITIFADPNYKRLCNVWTLIEKSPQKLNDCKNKLL